MLHTKKQKNKKVVLYLPGSVGDNFIVLALAEQLRDVYSKDIVIASNKSKEVYSTLGKDLGITQEVYSARSLLFLFKLFLSSFFRETSFVFFLTPDSKSISYMSFIFQYFSRVNMIAYLFTDIHVKPHFFGINLVCTEQNTLLELFDMLFKTLGITAEAKNPYLVLPERPLGKYSVLHLYPSALDRRIEKQDIRQGLEEYFKANQSISPLIFISGAASDIQKDSNLKEYLPDFCEYIDMRGLLPLPALMHMIRNAEAYFGVHTGPTHIAAMFHKKGIAFYKQERPVVAVRYNTNCKVVSFD